MVIWLDQSQLAFEGKPGEAIACHSGNAIARKQGSYGYGGAKRAEAAMKRALICRVSGQDGAYLAELLLTKGYEVFGTSRDAQLAFILESRSSRPAR